MADLEQTQAIFLEDFDVETDEENEDGKKKIVSFLKVLKQEGFPEKLYPLYEGDNVIGRQEDVCNIAIPLKALSRQHACIEIRGETHLLYDKGSRNKTKKGKLYLTPEVRYEVKDNDSLTFGDVKCLYLIGEPEDGNNSETGSESDFQTAPSETIPIHNLTKPASNVTTLVYESGEEEEDYDSENSVDLLQPTQAYVSNQNSGKQKSRLNFDVDSEEEDNDIKGNVTVKDTPAPNKFKGKLSSTVVLPESGSETEEEEAAPTVVVGDTQKDEIKDVSLLTAPTQAYVGASDDDMTGEDTPKKELFAAETQSFTESSSKKPVHPHALIAESDTEGEEMKVPVTEVEVSEDEEENEEEVSHLFANPTMACDVADDMLNEDEDEEEDKDNSNDEPTQEFADLDAPTQAFTDLQTHTKSKTKWTIKEKDDDATQVVDDSTVAIDKDDATVALGNDPTVAVGNEDDATQVFSDDQIQSSTKKNDKSNEIAAEAETVYVEVDDASTQVFNNVTDGPTLAVNCDSTQVFEDKTHTDATVAIEEEATQVLKEDRCDDATVALECEATQVFDNKVSEEATAQLECEDTQVFENKISEVATVQVECEATQVFDNKVSEDATVQLECEATQVIDKRILEDATVAMDDNATQVLEIKVSDDATVAIECDETQVVEDKVANDVADEDEEIKEVLGNNVIAKKCEKDDTNEDTSVMPPQKIDEASTSENSKIEHSASDNLVNSKKIKHTTDETVCFDETHVSVMKKKGRHDKEIPVKENVEVKPKRSGRISNRKLMAAAQEEDDKDMPKKGKGRGQKAKKSESETTATVEEDVKPRRGRGKNASKTEVSEADIKAEKETTKSEKSQTDYTEGLAKGSGRRGKNTRLVVEEKVDNEDGNTPDESEKEIEATQPYCMEHDDELLEPTQPYCMDEEKDNTTPPIAEVLGVEVVDGEPSGPVNLTENPAKESIVIPPVSPHRPALASPTRQKSPSPKKVTFARTPSENLNDETTGSKLKNDEGLSTTISSSRGRRSLPLLQDQPESSRTKRGRHSVASKLENLDLPTSSKPKGRKVMKDLNEEQTKEMSNNNLSKNKKTKGKGRRSIQVEDTDQEMPPLEELVEEKKDEQDRVRKSRKTREGSPANIDEIEELLGKGSSSTREMKEDLQADDISDKKSKVRKGKGKGIAKENVDENLTADEDFQKQNGKPTRGKRKKIANDDAEIETNMFKEEKDKNVDEGLEKETNTGRKKRKSKDEEEKADISGTSKDSAEVAEVKRSARGKKMVSNKEEISENTEGKSTKGKNKKNEKLNEVSDDKIDKTKVENEAIHENLSNEKTSGRKGRSRKSVQGAGDSEDVEATILTDKSDKRPEQVSKDLTSEDKKGKRGKGKQTTKLSENLDESSDKTLQEAVPSSTRRSRLKPNENKASEESSFQENSEVTASTSTCKSRSHIQKTENLEPVCDSSEKSEKVTVKKTKGKTASAKNQNIEVENELNVRVSRSRDSSLTRKAAASAIDNTSEINTNRGRHASEDKAVSNNKVETSTKEQRKRNQSASMDSLDDTEKAAKGAIKRGHHKTAAEEVPEEVPSKKSKMDPPATPQQSKRTKTSQQLTPQQTKKSSQTTDSPSASLRRKSAEPKPKIMFTGVVDEQGQKTVKDLGGEMVDSVHDCTHLITDKVRRTVKFLCCLSRGVPIVTPIWLESCRASGMFVDHGAFIVKDEASERQHKFSLQKSLDKASEASLLTGFRIHVTKSVKPDPPNMKEIVNCAGAEYLDAMPRKAADKTVVISCVEDKAVCDGALKAGLPIVNAEFILTGILRQEVSIDSYKLFEDKKRPRDSSLEDPPKKRKR